MRMTKQGLVLAFFLCFVFSACTSGFRQEERSVGGDVPDPAKPPEEFYVVGPGDVLNVTLWKEPGLSGPVTVRPDGFITLPLVNEVQVVGLTTEKLRTTLEQK